MLSLFVPIGSFLQWLDGMSADGRDCISGALLILIALAVLCSALPAWTRLPLPALVFLFDFPHALLDSILQLVKSPW